MAFDALFQPIKIGSMEVTNRLVKPPMGSNLAEEDHSVGQRMVEYYEEAAKGGFGLVTIEVTAVAPNGLAIAREPGLWCDEQIEGYRSLAEAIHRHGGKMSVQLHHCGRQAHPTVPGLNLVSASPIACPFCQVVPHELSTREVYGMIDDFVQAAVRAKKAGADAVEVHMAHGYMIAQFASSYSNRRYDEFGGSFENRMRFARCIIEGIRRELGRAFPVIVRVSGEEKSTGGMGIAETRAMCRALERYGVDAFHVSAGTYGREDWLYGAYDAPMGYLVQFAEDVKRSVSVPVIAVGRINDPYIAEEIVASGRADMVSIGRQSIADPHFPNKVLTGKLDEIIPCIGCHQGCSGEMSRGKCITCVVNPLAGANTSRVPVRTQTPKRVLVAGAGPAGMECAWTLARRGHQVDLYEKQEVAGGQFRYAAFPPCKGDLAKMLYFYQNMCKKSGVRLHLNTEVGEELIREEKPDAVVLATGGIPLHPPIPGIHDYPERIVDAVDVLGGNVLPKGKILIAGGGEVGIETAEYLGEYGRDVTVIEMRKEIGADVEYAVSLNLKRRLKEYGTKFLTGAVIKEFRPDGAVYEKDGETAVLDGFDSIVLALGSRAYNPLEETARKYCSQVWVIGDAKRAGQVLKATAEALEAGLSI